MEMPDVGASEEPERQESAAAPTAEEDQNLVVLLDGGREEEVLWLPEGGGRFSDTYFVKVRRWTYADMQRYNATGTDYQVPYGKRPSANVRASFRVDAVAVYKMLVEQSVVDFRLRVNGREAKYTGPQSVWGVFRDLPVPVGKWLSAKVRAFQGIEEIEAEERAEGEA